MAQKNIYPPESIEFSSEYLLSENTIKSQIIYSAIIFSIIAVIFLLPFISVDITVTADGLIRPESEKTEIRPITSGIVTDIYIKESQNIYKGDTLLRLKDDEVKSKLAFTEFQIAQKMDFISDLERLLILATSSHLKTEIYRQTFVEYRQKKAEIENRQNKYKKELDRNSPLYEKGVISGKELDDLKHNLNNVNNELKIFIESTRNSWQSELLAKQNDVQQLNTQLIQYSKDETSFIIKAPVSGTIEQFSGIYIGSNIQAGQTVVIISPESGLIAEVYAAPKDIGYLSTNTKANIQVLAFNYNDWGMIHGEVIEISKDYMLSGDKPYFRVRCNLDKTYLQLKNGFKGNLKKGMTIRSRFIITKRSLWQLLFDNLNDWMNPAMNNNSK